MAIQATTFRAEFPLTETWSYLNHAAIGPFSTRTVAAVQRVARAFAAPPSFSALEDFVATARENVAALVNGSPNQVAFVGSLADAMSLCAAGIDWRAGDNVVIPAQEFPSVVYPFLNTQRRGVEVRFVEKDARGFTDLDRVAAAIDGRTRALVLSHVEFMDGFRNDLDAIGRLCRERDILSVIDGTQSIGALAIDVAASGIDVIASHGYKWLMAGFGLGVMHLSERAIERIAPTYVGRLSVELGFEELEYALNWQEGALRFQTGGLNWITLAAFNASAELIRAAGPAWTEQHTLALTDRLLDGAAARGYQVASCLDRPHRSQIVAFTSGDRDTDAAIVEDLERQQISVSLRGKGIRVSPYFYNTDEDVDRLLEALPRR